MKNQFKIVQLKPDLIEWDPVYYSVQRKPSAVALLIFSNCDQEPHVLLIRRSTRLSSHKGQIGFPGGRLELGDSRPRDTALRETAEEVGLDPALVSVLGGLDPIPALDGSLVYPIIGTTSASVDDLRINPIEVDAIFLIPLSCFTSQNLKKFGFNLFGCWRRSFLYDCGSMSVWGLSAEILAKADLQIATETI